MATTAQSAEHSLDESTSAVWWTTAGIIPAHIPPPATNPPGPPMGGRRGFMLALCGLTVMLTLGAASPSDQFPFAEFIERAGLKCPVPTIETRTTPAPAPATPPTLPETPSVAPTAPPPARPPTIKKPTAPRDAFTHKAKQVQRDVMRRCVKHVKPGRAVKVRVHHDINAMTARVSTARPENPTYSEAELCVLAQVQSATNWPTNTARIRTFEYRVKGPPTR